MGYHFLCFKKHNSLVISIYFLRSTQKVIPFDTPLHYLKYLLSHFLPQLLRA
jgi:hypothetical protein